MINTWNALIAALLLITFAGGCAADHASGPVGPAGDSIIGYDLALAPLHYVDSAGRIYELLLAMGPDGKIAAASYVVDGALFASIVARAEGAEMDVQIHEGGRAVFRALVTPAALPSLAQAWPSFAAAAGETRVALAAWQGSASAGALARLHVALGKLASASAALLAPVIPGKR